MEDYVERDESVLPSIKSSSDSIMVLGQKLDNPYSVTNMVKALDSLKARTTDYDHINITSPTHYYVRYLPANDQEMDVLKNDTSLILFDFPLDYEISNNGTYYHDPAIPDTQITWQYTVVDNNYQFEQIQYEIIEPLVLPETAGLNLEDSLVYTLVDKAFDLTGNEYDIPDNTDGWHPQGVIRVYDDVTGGYVNLEGVKVIVRRWFLTWKTYTNADGYFFFSKGFKNPVHYAIKWENTKYDIRNGLVGQAWFVGPKQKSRWNLDISSDKNLRFATIHRAAYRYFHKDIGGLKRPNIPVRLKLAYLNWSGTGMNFGNVWMYFLTPWAPNILIFGYNSNGTYKSTDVVFRTTVHEIGHTSHIELMNAGIIQFGQVSKQIRESWADAIEWYISTIEYVELGQSYWALPDCTLNNPMHKQTWNHERSHDYTPLFIDCVDEFNQSRQIDPQPVDLCPEGGYFNGNHCYIDEAPQGENAFIYNDNFYYTPIGCCTCPNPGSWFDGANCFAYDIPDDRIGFIWQNNMYLYPVGNIEYPYDQISGYTMSTLENYVIKTSYGLSSVHDALEEYKPAIMTDKHLSVYLNYYYKL